MTAEESLELAIHRALRAEVPPWVRAIVAAQLSLETIVLHVFHYGPAAELSDFEETVESELEHCLPSGLGKSPRLSCEFLPAEMFKAVTARVVVHNNPWAAA